MSFDKPFTSKSELVAITFGVVMDLTKKIEALEEKRKLVIDRVGGLIQLIPRSDNPNLPVSSCYFNFIMGIGKRQKEEVDNDNDEEFHVASKKQRIEKEYLTLTPLSFSSSSSSSSSSSIIKPPRVLTSVHKDVYKEGKRRWKRLIKIPNITEA
jgi:hypothetical protein